MISSEIHSSRLKKLRGLLAARDIDALLVTDITNIFYLTGFTGSTAAAIVTSDVVYLLVDPRYSIQARAECPHAVVRDYTGKPTIEAAAEAILDINPHTIGFEADQITVDLFRHLGKRLRGAARTKSTRGLMKGLRQIKDAHEIALIRQASEITDAAFEAVLPEIKPGITEKQLALRIDCAMRELGADKEGFDTIAASGPNSACPHAHPTDRILRTGDLVKMDFGARYAKYNSDITRTVVLSKPDSKQRKVYEIVLEAQLKAIEAVAPGKSCREIDSIARDHIASAGYGDNFGHGLGHSFGIEVHEEPRFSQTSDAILEPGMVMTVEPGIYIEGWGGIRIEDDVLVTDSGRAVVTNAPKAIISM